MTGLLEDIYRDIVATLALSGGDADLSLCANELRSIRNRIRPLLRADCVKEAEDRALHLAKSAD